MPSLFPDFKAGGLPAGRLFCAETLFLPHGGPGGHLAPRFFTQPSGGVEMQQTNTNP